MAKKKPTVQRRTQKSPDALEYWASNRQESYRPLEPPPFREHEENWQDWLDRGDTVMDSPTENFLRDVVNKVGMVLPIPRDAEDVAITAALAAALKGSSVPAKKTFDYGRNLYRRFSKIKSPP